MRKYIFLIPVLILFISCDKNTNKTYSVKNDSSETIFVRTYQSGDIDESTQPIISGQTEVILVESTTEAIKTEKNISDQFVTFKAFTQSGQQSNRNLLLNENWNISIEKTSNNPINYEHQYTCTITDVDFE
jgi:hypothetical protein